MVFGAKLLDSGVEVHGGKEDILGWVPGLDSDASELLYTPEYLYIIGRRILLDGLLLLANMRGLEALEDWLDLKIWISHLKTSVTRSKTMCSRDRGIH